MNDSDYVVVFNILDHTDRQWWWPDGGLLLSFLVFLVIAIFWIIKDQKLGEIAFFKLKVRFLAVSLVFTLIVLPLGFIGTYRDYWTCANALASGQASHIEGTVDNFIPMPYYGHAL